MNVSSVPLLDDYTGSVSGVDAILRTVPLRQPFPTVRLIPPTESGFILLAAEVDRRPPFLGVSAEKRDLLEACKRICRNIRKESGVHSAVVFKALLVPPGGERPSLRRRRPPVHQARFDLVILIETASVGRARRLRDHARYRELEARVRRAASHTYTTTASNVKRIGAVDHSRAGVFLFNYFVADRYEQNLAVWEHTAGWFQEQTGLDNSTLLRPAQPNDAEYTVINHCRWDRLRDVLPSLIFKRSFKDYVLAHFEANNTAPMPVLYRLA